MALPINRVVIGTRGSALARWQTDHVAGLLRAAWPGLDVAVQIITTQGDRVLDTPLPQLGGKGVFTAELEAALRGGNIDLAVHSLKDLPTDDPDGLTIGAIPAREVVNDVFVSRSGVPLAGLPHGATIGTSSRRRAAQLLHARLDLTIADVRGNVDTRLRKAHDPGGPYDGIILAAAGLLRLGFEAQITERLTTGLMLPAPGQGALAVQCRDEATTLALLAPLNDTPTRLAITAERAFLAGLGGGCALPIAAYATVDGDTLRLRGRVSAPDGSEQMDFDGSAPARLEDARLLGAQLAADALAQGVRRLLESLA